MWGRLSECHPLSFTGSEGQPQPSGDMARMAQARGHHDEDEANRNLSFHRHGEFQDVSGDLHRDYDEQTFALAVPL